MMSWEPEQERVGHTPELLEAMNKIADLARPGQKLGISDAIDVLCDIWNVARAAIAKRMAEEQADALLDGTAHRPKTQRQDPT